MIHQAIFSDLGWGTLGAPEPGAARLVRVVETPVAILRHAFYEKGAIVGLHRHDCDSLVYGVGGPCREDNGAEQIIKRRLTFHPRGYEHKLAFGAPTHVLAIEIREEREMPARRSTPLPATLYDHVWRAMLRIADRQPAEAVAAALADLLDDADAFLRRPPPDWLMAVTDHVHAHWRVVPSARDLARRFAVSPQHLCRSFKRHNGVTIQQYAVALRLDYARGLLWGTGMPISQVAAETGFADQSHLTRVLVSHSARTPARLRWRAPCLGLNLPDP
jgi:AraC-like DNA-binding protein